MVAISYHRVGLGYYSSSLHPLLCPVCVGSHGSHCPQKFYCVELAGQAGGISGCPADGRLLPEQRGLCPSDSPSTPSLLLDPTLLCCPFFSLVLRTPKTTQAANEILPKTVARVTGLVLFSGNPLGPRPAPLLWLPSPSPSPPPLLWVVENDPNTLPFEPATAPLETRQVPNWLGHWRRRKGIWLMSHLGWVASWIQPGSYPVYSSSVDT